MRPIQGIKKQIFITAIMVVVSFSFSFSQPSYYVGFRFKFFDDIGNSIDCNLFYFEDYQLLGMGHRNDDTSYTNTNDYMQEENFYNDSTREFNAGGSIVYNDLIRKFVHKKDTMVLILSTKGGGNQFFKIDSLIFKSGKYYIKEKHLKRIDYRVSEVDYYNLVLNRAIGIKKNFMNYKNSQAWIELNSLRRKYDISNEDYEKKTVSQIFK